MMVLTILMAIGLALIKLADGQQPPAADERSREAATNLAEAALNAQVFQLSRLPWPASAAGAPAATCTASAATPDSCPDTTSIAASFAAGVSPDYRACTGQQAWTTWVRDNGGGTPSYYRTTTASGQPAWDANGDGALWVGATGVSSRCKPRTMVTQVKANYTSAELPAQRGLGELAVDHGQEEGDRRHRRHARQAEDDPPAEEAGRRAGRGGAGALHDAAARPASSTRASSTPRRTRSSRTRPSRSPRCPSKMFTDAHVAGFAQIAAADPTGSKYYPAGTCPPNLSGSIVVVEDLTGCPAYVGGNDQNKPGFLVIKKGRLTLAGKATFYGFVYHANTAAVNTELVYLTGSASIQGAVAVDGLGGVKPATKHTAIIYDPRGFSQPKVRTNAIAVPGTWRELDPGQ